MTTSVLHAKDFLLGIEDKWDLYYEAVVTYVQDITLDAYTYHLFSDKKTKECYYLSPRFEEHSIEGVFIEKRIAVNLFKEDVKNSETGEKRLRFYATGVLQLPDYSLTK